MKNFLTGLTLSAILLISVSCTKEQSALTVDSLPSTATITGKVTYYPYANTDIENQMATGIMTPAAGVTVIASVANSVYNANAEGMQYFETQTDENGLYTINIPVGSNPVTATLTVEPFYSDRHYVLTNTFNNTIVTLEDVLYNSVNATVGSLTITGALPNRVYETNMNVNPGTTRLPYDFDRSITLQGKVNYEVWTTNDTESPNSAYYYQRELRGLPNSPVKVVVQNQGVNPYPAFGLTVETTTNANGEYSVEVMMPSFNSTITTTAFSRVDVTVIEDFTHWYCYEVTSNDPNSNTPVTSYMWASQTVPVTYGSANIGSINVGVHDIKVPTVLRDLDLSIMPVNPQEPIYGVNTWTTASGATIPSTGTNNNALGW